MKKSLIGALVLAGGLLASAGSQAAIVNVGGVTWDTEAPSVLPSEGDFTAHGGVYETAFIDGFPGTYNVTGRGVIDRFNSANPNMGSYCPSGCELTFTFSMTLNANVDLGGGLSQFSFKDLKITVFLDAVNDYDGTVASASGGIPWLTLEARGLLSGFGTDIGTGSDTGLGSANLDVKGGLAAAYFDTNTKLGGTDMVFSSSFQPFGTFENGLPILTGTFDLKGDSVNVVSEPTSLALLGLGLIGLAGIRRRNK